MAGADAAIQAALYDHLKRLDLPKDLPIAPEGKNFDGKGKAYLRPTYLPAGTVGEYIDDDAPTTHQGVYQVDVFWPINAGVGDPLGVAAAICAHFRRGTRLDSGPVEIRLSQPPSVRPVGQEPNWLMIPVQTFWEASAPPA